jgi:hypothetical protein
MPPVIQVGTVLIDDSPLIAQLFGLESEACSGSWRVVKLLDGFALDRRIHAAGWNFFFMAPEVKVKFLGAPGVKNIQNALTRILRKVKQQQFNCLEVTGIVEKRTLGIRYAIVSAHSRHIQQSCRLDDANARRTARHDVQWARNLARAPISRSEIYEH